MHEDRARSAKAIRAARISKGWTQEELAYYIGRSRQTVAALESAEPIQEGWHGYTIETRIRVRDVLELTESQFQKIPRARRPGPKPREE